MLFCCFWCCCYFLLLLLLLLLSSFVLLLLLLLLLLLVVVVVVVVVLLLLLFLRKTLFKICLLSFFLNILACLSLRLRTESYYPCDTYCTLHVHTECKNVIICTRLRSVFLHVFKMINIPKDFNVHTLN